jgi:hypothetical protein
MTIDGYVNEHSVVTTIVGRWRGRGRIVGWWWWWWRLRWRRLRGKSYQRLTIGCWWKNGR